MTLFKLCDEINIQSEIKTRVFDFANNFDFSAVNKQLKDFLVYEKMKEARLELQVILGHDEENIRMLTCMLKASADIYDIYKAKGISDKIYFDTMKCYTRFINETFRITGRLYFDRYWWTTRQAGCHLFRIGELEYEIMHIDNDIIINLHIPSDADFSPHAVDNSLECSRIFFAEYYPEIADKKYCCHSWLLDSQLKEMLSEESNIINFQKRFEIYDKGEVDTEFIEWLYNTKATTDYKTLPENTTLQRNMKAYLISGGEIRNSYGWLL
ncbi:MAG: DUF5596 domain-containing protein [Lachnospiraceae bacterium]|nr:DUF5596 domain-containing protein [Lachnospiraceae bacterium]